MTEMQCVNVLCTQMYLPRHTGVGADQLPLDKHVIFEAPINCASELGVYVTVAPTPKPPLLAVFPQVIRSYCLQNTVENRHHKQHFIV